MYINVCVQHIKGIQLALSVVQMVLLLHVHIDIVLKDLVFAYMVRARGNIARQSSRTSWYINWYLIN